MYRSLEKSQIINATHTITSINFYISIIYDLLIRFLRFSSTYVKYEFAKY